MAKPEKSYPPSADVDAWTGGTAELDEWPMIIRFRPDLQMFPGRHHYPSRLVISWDFGIDNEAGMPSDSVTDQMRSFEDAIVPAFDAERAGILAFVITHKGVREWHFQFTDINHVSKTLNEALCVLPRMPLDITAIEDPEWSQYLAICDSFNQGP